MTNLVKMAKNSEDDPLILNRKLSIPLRNMFNDLDNNETLRNSFFKDPFGIMKQYGITDTAKMKLSIGNANKLFFLILSNKKLMHWADKYEEELIQKYSNFIDLLKIRNEVFKTVVNEIAHSMDEELKTAFVAAIEVHGDPSVIIEGIRDTDAPPPVPPLAPVLIFLIIIAVLAVAIAVDGHDIRARGFDIVSRRDLGALADTINKGFEEEATRYRRLHDQS